MSQAWHSLEELDDIALIGRVATGGRDAFDVLMRRHEDLVFSVSLRIMGSRQAALDATQETFVTVFRKADRFRAESAFTTWLYRVTTNTCYDLLRKQKRRHTEPLTGVTDPVDTTAAAVLEGVELENEIARALTAIPYDFATAVILSDIQGMPLAEIAEVLSVPVGTVKSRIFRGRRLLAQILGNLRPTLDHLTDDA